jgi:predicted P-loop ATPase
MKQLPQSFSERLAILQPKEEEANTSIIQRSQRTRPPKDKLLAAMQEVLPLQLNLLTQRIELQGQPIPGDFLGTLHLHLAEEFKLDIGRENAADAAIVVAQRNHLQRQLIALVARAMRPGCELHTCLVIHSDRQGVGKSQFWKVLGGEWFSDSLGDLQNLKDDLLTLHSAWIHEWGEIDRVLGKRESEAMKRFLSACQDDVRRPYARSVERLQRSCGIVGTTNRRDFIKDFTGNRRFPIISIKEVRSDWVAANRHKIWASAFVAYSSGSRWHYNHEEIEQINETARSFAAADPLLEHLEAVLDEHPTVKEVCVAQALVWMGRTEERRDQQLTRSLARCFQQLGWERGETRRRFPLSNGVQTDKTNGWIRPPK